jgi:hypothetical protein
MSYLVSQWALRMPEFFSQIAIKLAISPASGFTRNRYRSLIRAKSW